jgi:hypothetical protein
VAIQLDVVDQGIADNREIGPRTCPLEVGIIGRDPLLAPHIHREGRDAAALRRIMVVGRAISQRERRRPESQMEW